MNLGTLIYTWLFGNFVGNDEFGNKYFCNSNNLKDRLSKRWVIYNGEIEASKIPPHWHAWLHKTIDDPPINYTHQYEWQKNHKPNLTGTTDVYLPDAHPISSSKKETKDYIDYEKWHP